MIDLQTGSFVIDAEKGFEIHPFMSREEFMNSPLFKSEYLNKRGFSMDDPYFCFHPINIDGNEMFLRVHIGGRHNCVRKAVLISKRIKEIDDYHCMPENWKEIAYDIKREHDEFLLKQTQLGSSTIDPEKDNWFDVKWGSFRSSFCLRYDDPYAEIVISYDNLTPEDNAELEAELEEFGDDCLY